jgi:hypothetical protein
MALSAGAAHARIGESQFSRVVNALPGLRRTAFPDRRIDFRDQGRREYSSNGVAKFVAVGEL